MQYWICLFACLWPCSALSETVQVYARAEIVRGVGIQSPQTGKTMSDAIILSPTDSFLWLNGQQHIRQPHKPFDRPMMGGSFIVDMP
jgi:hypothetical protein